MTASVQTHQGIWQPKLGGTTVVATPLQEADYDALFVVASDPELWATHFVKDRYLKPKFDLYFRSRMDSKGALLVSNKNTGEVIGSSRFSSHDPEAGTVEIGGTFFKRSYWGTGVNRELKILMLTHAFKYVEIVKFLVGINNFRSQAAMKKIGGRIVTDLASQRPGGEVVFHITKMEFSEGCNKGIFFV